MPDEAGSFTVNGRTYSIPTELTVGEMVDAENLFGVDFSPTAKRGIAMASAMMFIAVRREDATVTVDDIRNLPAEVFATVVEAGDARPPESDDSASRSSSGEDSEPTSDSTNGQKDTGSPGSDIGSASDLVTSVT